MDRKRILIIEDEDSIRIAFQEILRLSGYSVQGAENGKVGLDRVKNENPDLILCDIEMPVMDGYAVLEELRKDPATAAIPFIFLTGRSERPDQRRGMNLGADDYLTKPCTRQELLASIQVRLEKKKVLTERFAAQLDEAKGKLEKLLHYDQLTGLPNRLLLRQLIQQSQEKSKGKRMAVLAISLERFKRVSEALGGPFGDVLLRLVSDRLRAVAGEAMLVHSAPEEFIIALADQTGKKEAADFAGRVTDVVSRAFILDTHEIYIGASIGISFSPDDDQETEHLLKKAFTAMNAAKKLGGGYQFYSAEMKGIAAGDLVLEASLRRALENEELQIHYQPQIDLRTGAISGVEALLRWHNSSAHGFVSPALFIPLAEESGLIQSIGDWVLNSACTQAQKWHEAGYSSLRLAVNLSAIQFLNPDITARLGQILTMSRFNPRCLELEVTESVLMQNAEQARLTMMELKKKGIAVSIDDFGTGYASLMYLKQFPFDTLKIDQTFIHDLAVDSRNAALTKAIIEMAHDLNLRVVAEGVENSAELFFLCLNQCDEIQGFVFSPAVPAPELEAFLRSGKTLQIRQSQ